MLKRILEVLKYLIYSLPYIFVFLSAFYVPKDPDLGWHLRYGEYFFQHHSLLRENLFSSTMQNYLWANESWGTDIISYFTYKIGGFFALSAAGSIMTTLTFLIFSKAARLTYAAIVISSIVISYLLVPMSAISFRGQQISLLFLGILFFILSRYKHGSKMLFSIPLLFFIWCNIHGEVFLGLGLVGIYFLLQLMQGFIKNYSSQKKIIYGFKRIGIIFVLSCLATALNPWGIGIHLFAFSHTYNYLLFNINEYIPFKSFSGPWVNQLIITLLVCAGIIFLVRKRSFLKNLPIIIITATLIVISLLIQRYAWPAYYISIILFGAVWSEMKFPKNKYMVIIFSTLSFLSILFMINIKPSFNFFVNTNWDTYCRMQFTPCSKNASNFLIKNKIRKNIFTYYDWGGWLIWNYPEIKPSIDGRMLLWRDGNGYSETKNYNDYINAKKNINKSNYEYAYIPNVKSPLYFELSDLITQNKWKIVYEDSFAFVIKKMK